MDYGNLLGRSWRVVWNHKFMFVLGFLAALGGGLGSGNNFNYQMDGGEFQNIPFLSQDPETFLPVLGAMAVGALCFAVLVGIALWLLRLTAEAGLIDAASRLDAGQKSGFSAAMSAGWHKVWSFVGLSVLLFGSVILAILAVTAVLGVSIAGSFAGAATSSGDIADVLTGLGAGLIFLLCCLICGLALLAIFISVVYTFAQRAIVLEDLGVIDSIRRSWQVIRANLGEVIVLLIIFLALGLVVSLIIWLIFIPLGAISFGPGAIRVFSGEALSGLDIFLMVVGGLLLAVIVAAIRSFYVAFQSSVYTLAFQEFTTKRLPEVE